MWRRMGTAKVLPRYNGVPLSIFIVIDVYIHNIWTFTITIQRVAEPLHQKTEQPQKKKKKVDQEEKTKKKKNKVNTFYVLHCSLFT